VQVSTGYKTNVIGFGWTNAVYLKMREIMAAGTDSKAAD
jgi:alpha,alpha-trehalase